MKIFKQTIVFAFILGLFYIAMPLSAFAVDPIDEISLSQRIEAKQLYDQARALRNNGQALEAQRLLENSLIINPLLASSHSLLAEILAANGQFDKASDHIEIALKFSPNDPDIMMAQARILSWQEKNAAALLVMNDVVADFPDYKDAEDFHNKLRDINETIDAVRMAWRADLSFSKSTFSRVSLTPWKQTTVALSRKLNDENSISFTLDAAERFSLHDVSMVARINHSFSASKGVYASLLHTIGAEFLPKWTVAGGGYFKIYEGNGLLGPTITGVDVKYSSYGLVKVKGVDVWLSQYLFSGQGWLTFRSINSFVNDGKNPKGYSIRGDLIVHDRARIYAGFADAPESDRGIVTTTTSYFGGMVITINPNLSFNAGYAHHDREGSYIRKEVGVGLTYKF